jgi:hypothetical protein
MFFLGTDRLSWFKRTAIPLFVSRRTLARLKTLPEARGPWALDSGGFTELTFHGRYTVSPEQYVNEVERYQRTIGRLQFAAVQDWMCEPFMLERTGKTVKEHQELTIKSYIDLHSLLPGAPWAPVLQGYAIDDYLIHAEMYQRAGINLALFPRVGVGSVCRRQRTFEIIELFLALRPLGLKLHGFGIKTSFIRQAFSLILTSFDSMAWSLQARKRGRPLDGCEHRTCSHCLRYALQWRDALISVGERPRQEFLMLTT